MSSNVALRIAYFSLNLVGGFAMTIMIITLCLEIRRLRQGMFVATLVLCSSRIISTVVSSLLLFSGSMTGKNPSETLCIVQSSLHNAQTPFISYAALSYTGTILLLMSHSARSSAGVTRVLKATFLAIPFSILLILSIISITIITQQLNNVVSPLFYCALDHKPLRRAAAILSAIALFATLLVVLCVFYGLGQRRSGDVETAWVEELSMSLLLLGMYTAVRTGFWIANYIQETVASDMLDAVDGIVLFFIIATQGWLRSSWNSHFGRSVPEQSQATSQSPPPQVYHHSIRQVISVPSVIDVRQIHTIQEEELQSPKLLALASAMGLGPLESPPSIHEVTSSLPKFQFPERRVYSVEPTHGSATSFKSTQYGVALGHPSRDASRNPTPAHLEGYSDEAIGSSFVILAPTPDKWSDDGDLNENEEAIAGTNTGDSQVSYPQRTYMAPLFRQSHTPLHMSAAIASSGGDRLSLEEVGGQLPRSFLRVSVDSRSHSGTPRSQEGEPASFQYPAHLYNGSVQTVEITTEEGAIWSTSSESNPAILIDASASSLSWPNVSPPSSDFRHYGMSGSNPNTLGVHSPAVSANQEHRATPSTVSSRYHTPTTASPSPLSLEDSRHHPRTFLPRPNGPSPEPHPFARGVSPFRPPGLHLRSYSDGT